MPSVRRVGFEHNRDFLRFIAVTEGPEIHAVTKVGIGRSVLVFENRLLEILVYLVVGIILFVLGLYVGECQLPGVILHPNRLLHFRYFPAIQPLMKLRYLGNSVGVESFRGLLFSRILVGTMAV